MSWLLTFALQGGSDGGNGSWFVFWLGTASTGMAESTAVGLLSRAWKDDATEVH